MMRLKLFIKIFLGCFLFSIFLSCEKDPTSSEDENTVTDIDGNKYETVKIGDQWWMAENLKVTHYRNGDPIPNVTDDDQWENLDENETGAYCAYNNSESNADTYGYLYNWYAVDDSSGLAPEGWHVPSDAEWKQLEMYLGMSQSEADDDGWRGTNEGSQLAGQADLWEDGALEENAEFGTSGFNALPGGYRGHDGYFGSMGSDAGFWSSTESNGYSAWYRRLSYFGSEVSRGNYYERAGFSVRLVRD